jgi:hypothetical protein
MKTILSLLLCNFLAAQGSLIPHPEGGCTQATVTAVIAPTIGGDIFFFWSGALITEPAFVLGGTLTFTNMGGLFGWPSPCNLLTTANSSEMVPPTVRGAVKFIGRIPNNPALLGADVMFQMFQTNGLSIGMEAIVG